MPKPRSKSRPRPTGPRQPRDGEQQATCALPSQCRVRELLFALSNAELALALEKAPEPTMSHFCRGMGIEPGSRRTAQILRARLAKMQSPGFHAVAWMLSATPVESIGNLLGLDDDAYEDDLPDDFDLHGPLTRVLGELCRQWPVGLGTS